MIITIRNLQKKIPVYPTRIKRAIHKALASEAKNLTGEITVCIVNNKTIKELNKKYHFRNETTDVLAFLLKEDKKAGLMEADIVISADKAKENSSMYETTAGKELELYAVHGALHLLGYDDHSKKERSLMRKKECQYIKPKQ